MATRKTAELVFWPGENVSKRKRLWICGGLLIVVVLLAANAGKLLVIDAREKSDLILVLAGETDRRPALALELLDHGYGRKVVLDVPAEAKIYEFTQLQMAEKYVQDIPQRESVVICPIEGLSTRDEAYDVERCLAHEEGKRVLIVTSDFHTRRALSIFRHEVQGKTFSIAAARDETQFGTHWWVHRQWAKTCFEEWLRLLWWDAIDRWR
jgi:hypothetical protein